MSCRWDGVREMSLRSPIQAMGLSMPWLALSALSLGSLPGLLLPLSPRQTSAWYSQTARWQRGWGECWVCVETCYDEEFQVPPQEDAVGLLSPQSQPSSLLLGEDPMGTYSQTSELPADMARPHRLQAGAYAFPFLFFKDFIYLSIHSFI